MQPYVDLPRITKTSAQIVHLIRDAPDLTVSAGLELLDQNLGVLEDITDRLAGGQVQRQSYADLHGAATLAVEGELDWGSAIVRPYMVLTSAGVSARFNLGAYYTNTPVTELGSTPITFAVQGIDILDGLNTPVGEAYSIPSGASYLSTVESILIQEGFTQYVIDTSATNATLPTARAWVIDENTTWLKIVNDLLGSVGYQGIWSDWDGKLRAQPYVTPANRRPEWTYDVVQLTSMVTLQRSLERDFYKVPNRWVFVRSNNVDGTTPVLGDGLYIATNQSAGPTSIEARGGRVITRVMAIDVADQTSLVAAAQISIDADLKLATKVRLGTSPNPLHWHFDVMTYDDPAVGPPTQKALCTSWVLPLDGGNMNQEWTLI